MVNSQNKINVDDEFLEVLETLKKKIQDVTWGGIEHPSNKELTRILARKIKSSKMLQ